MRHADRGEREQVRIPGSGVGRQSRWAFFGTDDARAAGELDAADLARVEQVLAGLGYVVVPEELLNGPYDGPSLLCPWRDPWEPGWWDRFFGVF